MKQIPGSTQCLAMITLIALLTLPSPVQGQERVQKMPGGHDLQHGRMPPGIIGNQRMIVRPQMVGYMQPVHFTIPDASSISIWNGSEYQTLDKKNPVVRLQVGSVYRLKVTDIHRRTGKEVFPSIEIVNRLYPPPGEADKFPVMVHITQEELENAVDGHYVHRVTYLENPKTAIPFRQVKGDQNYFRVRPGDDPLKVASELGRPMTLVRMGSRVPMKNRDGKFELGQAPIEFPGQRQSSLSRNQLPAQKIETRSVANPSTPPIVQTSASEMEQPNRQSVKQSDFQSDSITRRNPYALPKVELKTGTDFVPPIKNADQLRKQIDSSNRDRQGK